MTTRTKSGVLFQGPWWILFWNGEYEEATDRASEAWSMQGDLSGAECLKFLWAYVDENQTFQELLKKEACFPKSIEFINGKPCIRFGAQTVTV